MFLNEKKMENFPSKILWIFNVYCFMVTLYGWLFPSEVLQTNINSFFFSAFRPASDKAVYAGISDFTGQDLG